MSLSSVVFLSLLSEQNHQVLRQYQKQNVWWSDSINKPHTWGGKMWKGVWWTTHTFTSRPDEISIDFLRVYSEGFTALWIYSAQLIHSWWRTLGVNPDFISAWISCHQWWAGNYQGKNKCADRTRSRLCSVSTDFRKFALTTKRCYCLYSVLTKILFLRPNTCLSAVISLVWPHASSLSGRGEDLMVPLAFMQTEKVSSSRDTGH